MKTFATVSLFIFAIIFSGCEETKKVIDVAGSVQLSGKYVVNDLKGATVAVNNTPTLIFSALDKSIKGTTGCNSVFGNYTLDLYTISFTDIAVSEKACLDSNISKIEKDFLETLNNTGSYNLQDNILTLYSKTDRKVLLKATKDTNN